MFPSDSQRPDPDVLLAQVQAQGFSIIDVTTREADLEDVFVSLTSAANG